jgi:hypothetical protein
MRIVTIAARIAAATALAAAMIVGVGAPAQAYEFGQMVCGGVKAGSGWHTYPYGGYDGTAEGYPCRSQIDYIDTPTGGATSTYYFNPIGGVEGTPFYEIYAWVPSDPIYANARLDFSFYFCDIYRGRYTMDQRTTPNRGNWERIWASSCGRNCPLRIVAWSGMASAGYPVGLDAIRVVKY